MGIYDLFVNILATAIVMLAIIGVQAIMALIFSGASPVTTLYVSVTLVVFTLFLIREAKQ